MFWFYNDVKITYFWDYEHIFMFKFLNYLSFLLIFNSALLVHQYFKRIYLKCPCNLDSTLFSKCFSH